MPKFAADFHIHSKYSRATSKSTDLENLAKWAKIKGIKVLGTGDFTHPVWLKEIREKLNSSGNGLYCLSQKDSGLAEINFILTAEISCIYSKAGKVRKIHAIIFAPNIEIAEKINSRLDLIGNLKSDGRPILGLDVKELAKIVLDISPECLIVPAHCMTPWFAIFGSKSGFDSIEECFEEYSKHIYAVETGLSADPKMLWRMPNLDNVALISNSDAHSPQKIGREANVFNAEISYSGIADAIKTKDHQKFLYTVEFFPEEGKYHHDGHRICGVRLSPKESKKCNNTCPKCKKPLTIGVLNRVEELAGREEGEKAKGAIPFKSLIPLNEIIADVFGFGAGSKKVSAEYDSLINKIGSEFDILLNTPETELKTATFPEIAEGIIKVREGRVLIEPGYDGVYGKIKILSETKEKQESRQNKLF